MSIARTTELAMLYEELDVWEQRLRQLEQDAAYFRKEILTTKVNIAKLEDELARGVPLL